VLYNIGLSGLALACLFWDLHGRARHSVTANRKYMRRSQRLQLSAFVEPYRRRLPQQTAKYALGDRPCTLRAD